MQDARPTRYARDAMNANEKGFNLFWDNYYRAFDWHNNSYISHWKARVQSLEVENALLRDYIHRELLTDASRSHPFAQSGVGLSGVEDDSFNNCIDEMEEVENCFEASEILQSSDEIDEDILAFYEKTMRHKIERKRQQTKEKLVCDDNSSDNEKVYAMGPITSIKNSDEMASLYGSEAPKILSMELSMQINFDMNCGKSNAQLWPNIPLRLS